MMPSIIRSLVAAAILLHQVTAEKQRVYIPWDKVPDNFTGMPHAVHLTSTG